MHANDKKYSQLKLSIWRSFAIVILGPYGTKNKYGSFRALASRHQAGWAGRFLLQVVSDIDDTLMCSGGFWPAGRDTRYPKRCQYPGALTFYSELDIGYNSKIQVKSCHPA